jgi:hypothetical protein
LAEIAAIELALKHRGDLAVLGSLVVGQDAPFDHGRQQMNSRVRLRSSIFITPANISGSWLANCTPMMRSSSTVG